MDPDEEWVEKAQQGDEQAFAALVKRHRSGVVRYCTGLLGCPEEAEQAAQDIFLRVWKNIHCFRCEQPFRHWLMRISTNTCLNLCRTKKGKAILNEPSLDDADVWQGRAEISASTQGIEQEAIDAVFAMQVLEIVRLRAKTLPPLWDALDWQIFMLWYGRGVETAREIGRLLAIPEGRAAYRIRNHILPTLKHVVEDMNREQP